jgi:hypothetical protein
MGPSSGSGDVKPEKDDPVTRQKQVIKDKGRKIK